jgi:organic hydroperoxide reductase OsmC/OhrA
MAKHQATISWVLDGEFVSGGYSRGHEWRFDGGAVVRASSSPEVVPVPMSDPFGVDPEEALIASVSSCHMLWFLSLAQAAGLDVRSYTDEAEADLGRIAPGRMAVTRITLRPDIAFNGRDPDATELDRLHHQAHEKCFIANALKAEVAIEPPRRS